jgi:hypothetical protein
VVQQQQSPQSLTLSTPLTELLSVLVELLSLLITVPDLSEIVPF